MTVKELIGQLEQLNPELQVVARISNMQVKRVDLYFEEKVIWTVNGTDQRRVVVMGGDY